TDFRARLAVVKALASLDPHAGCGLDDDSAERADGSYVMAKMNASLSEIGGHAGKDTSWQIDGPSDGGRVPRMQLLDVARSRAQRARAGRQDSESARARRPRAPSNARRLARSRTADRTLEGGKHDCFNNPDATRRTKWECSTSEAQCGGSSTTGTGSG